MEEEEEYATPSSEEKVSDEEDFAPQNGNEVEDENSKYF